MGGWNLWFWVYGYEPSSSIPYSVQLERWPTSTLDFLRSCFTRAFEVVLLLLFDFLCGHNFPPPLRDKFRKKCDLMRTGTKMKADLCSKIRQVILNPSCAWNYTNPIAACFNLCVSFLSLQDPYDLLLL